MPGQDPPDPQALVPDPSRLQCTRRDGGTDALAADALTVSNDSFFKSSLAFLPWVKAGAAQDARWEVDYTLGAAALLPPLAPTTEHRLAMGRVGTPGFLGMIESEIDAPALTKFGKILFEGGALTEKHETWSDWLVTLTKKVPDILATQPHSLSFASNDLGQS